MDTNILEETAASSLKGLWGGHSCGKLHRQVARIVHGRGQGDEIWSRCMRMEKGKSEDVKWPSRGPQYFCQWGVKKKAILQESLSLSKWDITLFEEELEEATVDSPLLCASSINLLNLSDLWTFLVDTNIIIYNQYYVREPCFCYTYLEMPLSVFIMFFHF